MTSRQAIPEAALARIWQEGRHARELRTVDGRRVGVVYRGVWTHAAGPDFRDALLEIDGRLKRGCVELHVRASDWQRHGHQDDPAYDAVVLHVVLEDDLDVPVCGPAGVKLPTVALAGYLDAPVEQLLADIVPVELGSLGARACLPTLAGGREQQIHDVLRRKGWERLAGKHLRMVQDLERLPAGEVLYRALLDALGLTRNRAGMAAVAERAPLALVEAVARADGRLGAIALLVGTGGFLPFASAHEAASGLRPDEAREAERLFRELHRRHRLDVVAANVWTAGRVRPGNHPVRRLASAGALIAASGPAGLLARFLELPVGDGEAWLRWLESVAPAIGVARSRQIAVNALAPFLSAYADGTGDAALAEQASALWETLPGVADDAIARSTLTQIAGSRRLRVSTALEVQGLHQIGRFGCAQLRCFECPIAELAVRYEPASQVAGASDGGL